MVDDLSFLLNDDEKLQYTRIEEKARNAFRNHSKEAVYFLNPFWQEMAVSISKRFDDIEAYFFDGINNAESKFLVFAPWYTEPLEEDYISIISFKNPYSDIKHSDVLGKILSLGIERKVIGDIIVSDNVYIVVSKSIESFILSEFRDIRKHEIEPFVVKDIIEFPKNNYAEKIIVVPSMRLDAITSKIYNISRTDAQNKISKGLLKLNYRVFDKYSYEIKEECMISLRGYGRARINEIVGTTQKGNLKIRMERLL